MSWAAVLTWTRANVFQANYCWVFPYLRTSCGLFMPSHSLFIPLSNSAEGRGVEGREGKCRWRRWWKEMIEEEDAYIQKLKRMAKIYLQHLSIYSICLQILKMYTICWLNQWPCCSYWEKTAPALLSKRTVFEVEADDGDRVLVTSINPDIHAHFISDSQDGWSSGERRVKGLETKTLIHEHCHHCDI